jgi:hypothetical protein
VKSYHAKYKRGAFVPFGNPFIPENSDVIITVLEPKEESRATLQRKAFMGFMKDMDNTPPLPPEFDEIIAQRINITREINL